MTCVPYGLQLTSWLLRNSLSMFIYLKTLQTRQTMYTTWWFWLNNLLRLCKKCWSLNWIFKFDVLRLLLSVVTKVTNENKSTQLVHNYVAKWICKRTMILHAILAHLSRRLIDERIVYTGILRPSVARRPSTFSNDISSETVRPILSILHT